MRSKCKKKPGSTVEDFIDAVYTMYPFLEKDKTGVYSVEKDVRNREALSRFYAKPY